METLKKYSKIFGIAFAGAFTAIFGAIVTLSGNANLGINMIAYHCGATPQPFLGFSLAAYPYCSVVVALVSALFWALVLAVSLMVIIGLGNGILFIFGLGKTGFTRFISWIKTASSKNIHLSSGLIHGNTFTLKLHLTEWRHLFRKIHVEVCTTYVTLNNDDEFFTFINEPTRMLMWKVYEIDYLGLDANRNLFWYKPEIMKNEKFKFPGILSRTINVSVGIYTRHGIELVGRDFFVETTSDGKKIMAKVSDLKDQVRINDNSSKGEDIQEIKKPFVLIEAPFTYRGPAVYPFLIRNEYSEKLSTCYAKLEVSEVHFNDNGMILRHHPLNLYPKKILWQAGSETIDLKENDPNYLHVLELGKHNFRFLFHGDNPLSSGEFEPKNLPKNQTQWLSHKFHHIKVTLYGDHKNGDSFEIQKEFALIFMVLDNNYTKLIKAKPLSPCAMKIREITSYENPESYFRWENN